MAKYILICFLIIIIPFNTFAKSNSKSDSLIYLLDSYLLQKSEYDKAKDSDIKEIKSQFNSSLNKIELFNICNKLFNEYLYYNMDSAFLYLKKQDEYVDDAYLKFQFNLNKISAFLQVGMYFEAVELINTINYENLNYNQKSEYLDLSIRVYSALMYNSAFQDEIINYQNIIKSKREELFALNDFLDEANIFVYPDLLIENNEYKKARLYLENILKNDYLTNHQKAIIQHLIAKTWDNNNKIKEHLILSAIYDIKASIKEYISLWQLAEILFEEGDIDRSYKYMKTSLQDASTSNIRLRANTISNIYPLIESTYQAKVEKQQKQIFSALIIISFLLIILLFILWLLYRHTIKLKLIRKELKKRNEHLKELNISLIDSSLIKEEYIGKYMEQSLLYLEKIEQYRRMIRKKIEKSTKGEVLQELKSTNIVDEELASFLQEFDKTFLSLFPDFVDEYNSLLIPEERSTPKNKGELDTELRVYALIRLGITDSDKIARFLGYSLSTIYNYRTKARNKYLGKRDDFEEKVKEIGIKMT